MVLWISKRIHKITLRKVSFILSVACGLIIAFSSAAFADQDISLEKSETSLEVSDLLNQTLIEYDNLYGVNESGTRAVDYAETIYNYLYGVMQPTLLQIRNNTGGTNTTTLYSLVSTMKSYLQTINASVQTPFIYGSSDPGLLGYSVLIKNALVSASGTSSVYDQVSQVASSSGSIATYTGGIYTNTSTSNTKLTSLDSKATTTNSHLNTIRSFTSSINGFLKNFNFTDVPQTTRQYSLNNDTYYSVDNITGYFNSNVYFIVDSNLNSTDSFIYHVKLPVVGGVLANVRYKPVIRVFTNNSYPTYDLKNTIYYIDSSGNSLDVYFVAPRFLYTGNSYFYIMIENSVTTYFSSLRDIKFEYISNVDQNKEYYDFLNFMIQSNLNDVETESNDYLKDLASVYASPEEVAARTESQAVIDETLDGFTGDGAAAAKVSDSASMKNASSSIRSGLDAGGTVNNALSVFDSSSGIWGWFSQSNYNDINNPSLQQRGDQVVDYYSFNQIDLFDLLRSSD